MKKVILGLSILIGLSFGIIKDTTTGSATTPNFSFTSDTNTGVYRITADTLGLTVGGVRMVTVNAQGVQTTTVNGTVFVGSGTGLTGTAASLTVGTASAVALTALPSSVVTSNYAANATIGGTLTTTTLSATSIGGTLSTASQPNITGVGTIATGVWNGTQIATGYVASGIVTNNYAGDLTLSGTMTANKLVANGGNIVLNTGYLSGDGGDEGVYVSANGNVGIGTTAPVVKFHVLGTAQVGSGSGTGGSVLNIRSGAVGKQFEINDGTEAYVVSTDTSYLSFGAGAAPRTFVMDRNGKIGIGVNPSTTLEVAGGISLNGILNQNGNYVNLGSAQNGSSEIHFNHDGGHNYNAGYVADIGPTFATTGRRGDLELWASKDITLNPGNSGSGFVGIGLNNPSTKLEVNGTVSASALQVNGSGTFTGTVSANKVEGASLYSKTVAVANATTVNVTIPGTQSIVMINVDGANSALFCVKSTGGSQGCYTMNADTGDFAYGTTANPGTAGKWNVWVVDSTTIAISDQNPAGGQNVRVTIFGN